MALTPFCSKLIADVGISMGDEGKGRLVCELVNEINHNADAAKGSRVGMVIKVNGGANSGHTAGGLKFNLLPCGVVTREVPCLAIGSGVVADPFKFWWEIKPLETSGLQSIRPPAYRRAHHGQRLEPSPARPGMGNITGPTY